MEIERTTKLKDALDLMPYWKLESIRVMASTGVLPASRVGHRYFVNRAEIREWVAARTKKGGEKNYVNREPTK